MSIAKINPVSVKKDSLVRTFIPCETKGERIDQGSRKVLMHFPTFFFGLCGYGNKMLQIARFYIFIGFVDLLMCF